MNPEIIFEGRRRLEAAGIENAERESIWLAGSLHDEAAYRERIRRRLSGEPLQYILGTEFFDEYEFFVGPGCLIPRPETLGMVELALAHLPQNGSVCEVGAGSGAISVTMALKRPDAHIYATEKYEEAFRWAERNRQKYDPKNLTLKLGEYFDPFPQMQFDVVAANLPYIPEKDYPGLQREVHDFEPETALAVPGDGTDLIRETLRRMQTHLNPGGFAVFEMDSAQGAVLTDFAKQLPFTGRTGIAIDCYGKDRFFIFERKKEC